MPQSPRENEVAVLNQRLSELHALTRVITALNDHSLELDQLLRASLERVQQAVNSNAGCVLLLPRDGKTLQLAQANNLPEPLRNALETFPAQTASDADPVQFVRDILQTQSVDTFILFPLSARGNTVGLLLILLSEEKLLQPPSIDLLMSIGEQVGMAIENARLHASLRESEEWHREFIENSPDGFWERDTNGTITFVNDAACRMVGVERAALVGTRSDDFVEDDSASRRAVSAQVREQGFVRNRLAKLRTHAGKILTVSHTTRLLRDAQGNPVRFQTVFRDVSEHAQLVEQITRRNRELAALNQIAEILANPREIERALDLVCQQIAALTGMETAAICLADAAEQFLNLVASCGVSDALLAQIRRLGLDDPLTRSIALEGNVVAFDDLAQYTGAGFAGPHAEGYHAGIAAPIKRRGKAIGALFVGSKTLTQYENSDVELLANAGNQIGSALESVDLIAQMQGRVHELEGLAQLSAALVSTLDPAAIYQLAADWTFTLFNAEVATLRLLRDDKLFLTAARMSRPGLVSEAPIAIDAMLSPLINERAQIYVNDAQGDENITPAARRLLDMTGMRALLIVPLILRDSVIGGLTVLRAQAHPWSRNEIELAQTIANLTAGAINNAQLYQSVSSEQRKVRAIFDSGLSGLFATDAAGRIVMFNRAAERITGWSRDEVLDKKWVDIFVDAASESLLDNALIRKQPAYLPEAGALRTHAGLTIPTAQAVAPLLDEKGEVVGAVGAFWDLTREKQAELQREHFLKMFAHQLGSPLTALLSALQLLDRRGLSKARRAEMLGVIKSEGARLKKFAQQFLDMEGAFAAPRPLQCESFSIVDLVRDRVRRFHAANQERDWRVKFPQPPPLVWADRERVENILTNLLDNAVTHSPAGTPVTVTIETLDDETVQVSVQDQGPGIPPAEHALVFEQFYRAARAKRRRVYGHGLGLTIARDFVIEMGGKIWVESQENHGATFHFTLRRPQ